jgi:hypothetical protein
LRHWNCKIRPHARVIFALFNCLVLGNTKYNGVQRVYCNPFPEKTFHGSHRFKLDIVMLRPPGVDNCAFIVSPETFWYAGVLLLFSASAATDTGSKSFKCALVSTLEIYDDTENGNYINHLYLLCVLYALYSLKHFRLAGICRFPCPIRARLQETNYLRHSN